ncbi:MAG: hypothetical protein EU981_02515 [Candidatus Liberibacter ctenarytainae]|uniref:Uncharacterized protein n=1 Tax=Candidatus Liberibacter ctenarytainae TaxID=2020335 RepID=A0A937DLZ0_9HYPH|nr:hypothetical protein [Candidatus Liberibacter ctenarytainae]
MSSKSEKRRNKKSTGRPCKTGVPRTESGRISRSKKSALPPAFVAQEARMRLFGLSALQASQEESGSRIGRLRLAGKISQEQYQAFLCFADQYRQYMTMTQVPDSLRRNGEYVQHLSYCEDADTRHRLAIKKRWLYLKQAIDEAEAMSSCNLWKALDYFLTRYDGITHTMSLHTIVDACCAMDVLVTHYGIVASKSCAR